jgi:hypothetical protein
MTEMDVMAARAAAIERLQRRAREVGAQADDPRWGNGRHNVKSWSELGFLRALGVVNGQQPRPGESATNYLTRVIGLVYAERDCGPDADDEAWFSSAIDESLTLIRG